MNRNWGRTLILSGLENEEREVRPKN